MARKYTADELIDTVQQRAMLPDVESAGTAEADILRLLNEELLSKILPALLRVREEYLVVTERTALVDSTSRYRLPTRAVGQKLRNIDFVHDSGSRYRLAWLSRKEADYYSDDASREAPGGFFLEGNHVVLRPSVGTGVSGNLEMSYMFRPGELVLEANARQVTAVTLSTRTVTLASAVPAAWTTSNTFDVHSGSSGAEIHVWDKAASTVSGTTITFSTAIDGSIIGTTAVAVGDYVVLAEQAVIPALPRELHVALAQAAVCRVVEQLGDTEALRNHTAELNREIRDALEILTPRVEGRPKKIRGSFNPLFGGGRPWSRGGYV